MKVNSDLGTVDHFERGDETSCEERVSAVGSNVGGASRRTASSGGDQTSGEGYKAR